LNSKAYITKFRGNCVGREIKNRVGVLKIDKFLSFCSSLVDARKLSSSCCA